VRLSGHHALITGGGTGIGAAIARALASEGAKLTLVGRRRNKLEETAAHLRPTADFPELVEGPSFFSPPSAGQEKERPSTGSGKPEQNAAFIAPADITDRAQVEAALTSARAAHGPLTILINNAGVAAGIPFAKVTDALWREMLAVNLDGMFHCCQAALPDLLAAPAGRIVTIASMAGLYGFAYASPYIAAKHGAVGLTRALAAEYVKTSLRVNAVCPGFVDTDMTAGSTANIAAKTGRSEAEARAELARLNPSGRLIAPDQVAAIVLDLVTSKRNGEAVEIA
jgi:NAD(P)-dependent dehydrogenase (short-subunit alcohol dehydrogenase family)